MPDFKTGKSCRMLSLFLPRFRKEKKRERASSSIGVFFVIVSKGPSDPWTDRRKIRCPHPNQKKTLAFSRSLKLGFGEGEATAAAKVEILTHGSPFESPLTQKIKQTRTIKGGGGGEGILCKEGDLAP